MDFFKKLFSQEGKEKDPVCGMIVKTQTAQYKSTYQENTSYFCSENCKSQFDASPKDYVEENATSSCCQSQTQPSANKSCC